MIEILAVSPLITVSSGVPPRCNLLVGYHLERSIIPVAMAMSESEELFS